MTKHKDTEHSEVSGTASAHPEEMTATMEIRAGERFSWKATARSTPAGLISAALLFSAVVIPALWFRRKG
jgi:hypothetical protein